MTRVSSPLAKITSLAVVLGLAASTHALPPGYTLEPLIPPGEAHSVSSRGLLDNGMLGIEVSRGSASNVVGNVAAYVRDAGGTWRSAAIPAGNNNQLAQLGAFGPEGNIYGTWRPANQALDQRAFVSFADGTFVDLGRLPNNAGNPSNSFFGAATAQYAALRTADVGYTYRVSDGQITRLRPIRPDGIGLSTAFGANLANGFFVGVSPQEAGSNQSRATLWRQDSNGDFIPTNLGLPAGAGSTDTSSARGLNDAGVVVGSTGIFSDNNAFVWVEGVGMQLLPRSSATSHFAYGINNDNLIVGYRSTGSTVTAVIWDEFTSTPVDLLSLTEGAAGWQFLDAQYINNSGQILGRGIRPDGQHTQFLLTPIPEPTSVGLAAAAGLLLLRRRR